jgi:hypothetical protein
MSNIEVIPRLWRGKRWIQELPPKDKELPPKDKWEKNLKFWQFSI